MQQQQSLKHRWGHLGPWLLAALLMTAAALARYLLIQPPEVAHQCDQGGGPTWCLIREAFILTYAHYQLGYASLVLAALAWVRPSLIAGALALACGGAALILYCYEPGAFALATGALVLARAQAGPAVPQA